MSKKNPTKFKEELEKLGIHEEIFSATLALSPTRKITVGYPQEKINTISVQQNW
jgi:hypothetical protein